MGKSAVTKQTGVPIVRRKMGPTKARGQECPQPRGGLLEVAPVESDAEFHKQRNIQGMDVFHLLANE